MNTDLQRLEQYLGTAGSSDVARTGIEEKLSRRLFTRELRREPPSDFVGRPMDQAEDVEMFVAEMRSSMDWFSRKLHVLGAQSEAFRRLSARAEATGMMIPAQVIAEAIAAYRLILGREPDVDGFDQFAQTRERSGLIGALQNILGSGEAARFFAPESPPTMGTVSIVVTSAAISILNAAGTDAALGAILTTRTSIDSMSSRIDAIADTLAELTALVRLRFDGDASHA